MDMRVKDTEKKLIKTLRQNDVVFAALFGSRAKKNARPKSDYDLLVDFDSSTSFPLSRFLVFKDNLENMVNTDVDIVTMHGLGKKKFKSEVLRTMKVLYDERKK